MYHDKTKRSREGELGWGNEDVFGVVQKKELTTNFFVVLLLISEVKGNQEVREKDASKRGHWEKKSV